MTSTAPTTPTPLRRWLQFSLRTLLVATLLACCVFGWMAYRSRSGRMSRLKMLGIGLSGLSPRCTKTPAVERLCRLLPNCSVDYGD